MAEQWVHGIAEDDFVLNDSNKFDSKEEACAAGEAEAIKLGLDTYFVGRLEYVDWIDLANYPDDIASLIIECLTDEAYETYGSDAVEKFRESFSCEDRASLEDRLTDTVKAWCGSLKQKGCVVVTDVEEFVVQEKPE